ncbi:MAG: MerR family transcriptional regulator [Firmicutes bacterium]|nr:MerR family transcriptional regulator [Bacillota bacterium]
MEGYLTIGEMAELHGISRQTLLYYDKIDLFKPEYVGENGYRYYSPYQIPFLREICFLKEVGIRLEDIRNHVQKRDLTNAISLLREHKAFVDREINKLIKTRQYIQQRLDIYTDVVHSKSEVNKPTIKYFPERKVLFFPFDKPISKQQLHLGVMKSWELLFNHGMLPAKGWGTIIPSDNLSTDRLFSGAGVFVNIPLKNVCKDRTIVLPEGYYACMYKYGMPYDEEHLYRLVRWIETLGYKIVGDVVDECLLDTTFYQSNSDVDFCYLQIPVEKS